MFSDLLCAELINENIEGLKAYMLHSEEEFRIIEDLFTKEIETG